MSRNLSPKLKKHIWVAKKKKVKKQKKEPRCFNCESTCHMVDLCLEPREPKLIRKNKKKFVTLLKNKESVRMIPSVLAIRD